MRFFRSSARVQAPPITPEKPAVPDGQRVYAIGDIHGRRDLLDELLDLIAADCAGRPTDVELIFLGDYVDRGPDSAAVIDRLATAPPAFAHCRFLCGNHEAAMLAVLDGDYSEFADWLSFGGDATLASYGIGRREIAAGGIVLEMALARVPASHRAFLAELSDTAVVGDYLFVHAGLRPGLPLAKQDRRDLLFIRQDFLDDDSDHGSVVVHGHSISETVTMKANRIGIDTGAYHSGRLTALVLDGTQRELLQTGSRQ